MNSFFMRFATLRNLPLLCGLALVLLLAALAVAGPAIAPFDPLDRTGAVRTDEGYIGPPFPPLTPGFLLGSDRYGRDLLSRVLWGIGPTMLMVSIVACVRLLLGLLIGVAAGWSRGWGGRTAGALTGVALALPTLLVALATITLVGIERGLPAFIIGLAITGWGEAARLAGEQTRIIRRQPYIEAAQALGAETPYLLARHLPRQLLPLAGTLLALEISATLMLTVALGFLGYYIGGGVWVVMMGDALPVAERTTEYPELGQMLSTVLERTLDPWPMVVVGGTVFIAILGFNLLGEGLRRQAEAPRMGFGSPAERAVSRLVLPLERGLLALALHRRVATGIALSLVATASIASGAYLAYAQSAGAAPAVLAEPPPIAGGHLWGSGRRDAGWTRDGSWPAGAAPASIRLYDYGAPIAGAPVIDAEGGIYLATRTRRLYALDAAAEPRWDVALPGAPVGGPALGIDGSIYVVDSGAGLTAYGPDGEPRWEFRATARREATSGPVVGPDGTIYFTMIDRVQAVGPDGTERWVSDVIDSYLEEAPRLTADGALVVLRNQTFSSADGSAQPYGFDEPGDEFSDPNFFIGADGGSYYRAGHRVAAWQPQDGATETLRTISWEGSRDTIGFPTDAGVARGGAAWLLYGGGLGDVRLVWLRRDGALLGNLTIGQRRSVVVAAGADGELVVCGVGRGGPECALFAPGEPEPRWRIALGAPGNVAGGALADGSLYVTTDTGVLVVVNSR
jgi:peptide/nickel transport system permease protein